MTDTQERRIEAVATPFAPSIPPQSFAGLSDIKARMLQYRQEYGEDRVKALSVPMGKEVVQVVVRAPSRLEYERHNEQLLKLRDGKTAQALGATRSLLLSCVLAPEVEVLTVKLDTYPALADKLGEKVLEMAGADAEVREETF